MTDRERDKMVLDYAFSNVKWDKEVINNYKFIIYCQVHKEYIRRSFNIFCFDLYESDELLGILNGEPLNYKFENEQLRLGHNYLLMLLKYFDLTDSNDINLDSLEFSLFLSELNKSIEFMKEELYFFIDYMLKKAFWEDIDDNIKNYNKHEFNILRALLTVDVFENHEIDIHINEGSYFDDEFIYDDSDKKNIL